MVQIMGSVYMTMFSGYVEEEDDFSELYEEEPIGLEDMLLEILGE